MSTRAVIARKLENGTWEGRYHHTDGDPEWLGKALVEARKHFDSTEAMLKFLVDDHPAGWSSIIGVDWSQPAGFDSDGPRCYCHGSRQEEGYLYSSADDDLGWCEYLYVIDPATDLMQEIKITWHNGLRHIATVEL